MASPFRRGALPRAAEGARLPSARLALPGAAADPSRAAVYARVCGFDTTGPLPITYPHVLGFPLAMRLMAGRGFPLPVLGLVHTRIEITRHRDIRTDDRTEISVHATGLRPHRRGTEVTMVTEARLDGELVWESGSRYLSRHPRPGRAEGTTADVTPARGGAGGRSGAAPAPGGRAARRSPADDGPAKGGAPGPGCAGDGPVQGPPLLDECASWLLPADLGRRYGAASGDRNPIHLYAATARAFGFPRAIAHGMWTFARCLAERNPRELRRAEAEFKAPVLLPGSVVYATADTDTGDGVFELRGTGREPRVHLIGRTATSVRPS
ncbi:MaoC/PaaZ C-terminal domain-containing protein [Streptomyces wuyuanensis]|uniref:MaoC family dehydratase n=1 Tax=Streptomyces wuyuanensis TaxID=1196353 RepID=UPI00342629DA